jgi:hypothetical protein
MTLNDFSRPALLLASLALTCACNKAAPEQDRVRAAENAVREAQAVHGMLAALPSECTVGTAARAPQGTWAAAPKGVPEPGHPYSFIQLFDAAETTGAVRAGLNRTALAALDKIEIRDGRGKWSDAGPVSVHEAPAGCDWVWLQQELGSPKQVEALRFSFRRSAQPVMLSEAGILLSPR